MKICLDCGTIYKNKICQNEITICPILDCSGTVIELEDKIAQTILILSRKNYDTKSSCAGHTSGEDPFITFSPCIYVDGFSELPKGFIPSVDEGVLTIRCSIQASGIMERQKKLMEANANLLEWAESLGNAVDMIVEFEIDDETDENEIVSKIDEEFYLGSYLSSINPDSGKRQLTFDRTIEPQAFYGIVEEIEDFAAENGIKVDFNI